MVGIEQPLFDQGSVQFMLFVVMIVVVALVVWITIAK
jgi:hypothetical protein